MKSQYPPRWKADVPWPVAREVGSLSWQDDAACQHVEDAASDRLTSATMSGDVDGLIDAYCRRCPVARECLQAGQEWRADGVWGGVVLNDGKVAPVRRREAS